LQLLVAKTPGNCYDQDQIKKMLLGERFMIKTLLADHACIGREVMVLGWLLTCRDSKALRSFLALFDGSTLTTLQCVSDNQLSNYNDVLCLTTGCSLEVRGILVESQGKGQSVELQVASPRILGWLSAINWGFAA
jgi:asparaginyl-tRNA synthetase